MLQKIDLVNYRKAVESMYEDRCTITEHQKKTNPDKTTGFQDLVVLSDQPCKLSFKTIYATDPTTSAARLQQVVKLFIAPEVIIKPGSKIDVTHNGVTTAYKQSGEPAIYPTHQEIVMELWKGWS